MTPLSQDATMSPGLSPNPPNRRRRHPGTRGRRVRLLAGLCYLRPGPRSTKVAALRSPHNQPRFHAQCDYRSPPSPPTYYFHSCYHFRSRHYDTSSQARPARWFRTASLTWRACAPVPIYLLIGGFLPWMSTVRTQHPCNAGKPVAIENGSTC